MHHLKKKLQRISPYSQVYLKDYSTMRLLYSFSDQKQLLYSLVYTSQGTMEQLLVEQTIQALQEQEKDNEKVRAAQKLQQQLEQKEREEEEKEQKYHQQLQKNAKELRKKEEQLQRKNRELQEKKREVEKEQKYHQQLQKIVKELQKKQEELQRKNRELQEKEGELGQSQDAVCINRQQDDHWVIDKVEVTLTKEELGSGSFATVNVGIFRGLRVAVKSLHTIIVSDYNLALFSREMSIASQVRHPNLVQFIGATKVGNLLILTELMSTSLHKELQKNQLTKQQILSIAQDVALGLNYLHLFKPQPIIHRDVSSPNVLLKPSTGPAGYEAKVADYGTAKLQKGTSTGTVMPGNTSYAAPEARDPEEHSPAMDVYSYSVLLMEMTLCAPPEMTRVERERQSHNVSWSPMKSLIQRGLNTTRQDRPTMSQVIESLREIKLGLM